MRIWLEHDPVALALLVIGLAGVELLAFIISLAVVARKRRGVRGAAPFKTTDAIARCQDRVAFRFAVESVQENGVRIGIDDDRRGFLAMKFKRADAQEAATATTSSLAYFLPPTFEPLGLTHD